MASYIGTATSRVDGVAKVTGAAKYAADAAVELATEKDPSGEAEARAIWAQALLTSGNVAVAHEQEADGRLHRLGAEVDGARVQAHDLAAGNEPLDSRHERARGLVVVGVRVALLGAVHTRFTARPRVQFGALKPAGHASRSRRAKTRAAAQPTI